MEGENEEKETKESRNKEWEWDCALPDWMRPSWPSWCEEISVKRTSVFEASRRTSRLKGAGQLAGNRGKGEEEKVRGVRGGFSSGIFRFGRVWLEPGILFSHILAEPAARHISLDATPARPGQKHLARCLDSSCLDKFQLFFTDKLCSSHSSSTKVKAWLLLVWLLVLYCQ